MLRSLQDFGYFSEFQKCWFGHLSLVFLLLLCRSGFLEVFAILEVFLSRNWLLELERTLVCSLWMWTWGTWTKEACCMAAGNAWHPAPLKLLLCRSHLAAQPQPGGPTNIYGAWYLKAPKLSGAGPAWVRYRHPWKAQSNRYKNLKLWNKTLRE